MIFAAALIVLSGTVVPGVALQQVGVFRGSSYSGTIAVDQGGSYLAVMGQRCLIYDLSRRKLSGKVGSPQDLQVVATDKPGEFLGVSRKEILFLGPTGVKRRVPLVHSPFLKDMEGLVPVPVAADVPRDHAYVAQGNGLHRVSLSSGQVSGEIGRIGPQTAGVIGRTLFWVGDRIESADLVDLARPFWLSRRLQAPVLCCCFDHETLYSCEESGSITRRRLTAGRPETILRLSQLAECMSVVEGGEFLAVGLRSDRPLRDKRFRQNLVKVFDLRSGLKEPVAVVRTSGTFGLAYSAKRHLLFELERGGLVRAFRLVGRR